MNTERPSAAPAPPGTHPNLLTWECDGLAYGVSFVPWDARIRLEPVPAGESASPRLKGLIALSGRRVPVFDRRTETASATENPGANTTLPVASMGNNAPTPMAMGLLVNAVHGHFHIPVDVMRDLARSN